MKKRFLICAVVVVVALLILGGSFAVTKAVKSGKVTNNIELGNKYLLEGDYQQAILAFQKVIEIEPKNIEARLGLAKAYIASGELQLAEEILLEAKEINQKRFEPYLALAELYISQAQVTEALAILKQGYEITENAELLELINEISAEQYYEQAKKLAILIDWALCNIKAEEKCSEEYLQTLGDNSVLLASLERVDRYKDVHQLFQSAADLYQQAVASVSENEPQFWSLVEQADGDFYFAAQIMGFEFSQYDAQVPAEPDPDPELGPPPAPEQKPEPKPEPIPSPEPKLGNYNAANSNNGGFAAFSDGWIYYFSSGEGNSKYGINKMRPDGSNKQYVGQGSYHINIVHGWIYSSPSIERMRLDGTERTPLSDQSGLDLTVKDGWIYYVDSWNGYKLYRLRVDGSGRELLTNDYCRYINLVEDWIYYLSNSEGTGIYRIRTDGTDREKLWDGASYLQIVDRKIFFSSGAFIYRVSSDWTNEEIVTEVKPIPTFNIADGWIYYSIWDEGIFRVHLDGTNRQKLSNDNDVDRIVIVEDWIFFWRSPYDYKLYRMRLDGSDWEIVD